MTTAIWSAEIALENCRTEADMLIAVSAALDEIAEHLPVHGVYDAVSGGGIQSIIDSIFGAKTADDHSHVSLVAAVLEIIRQIIANILNTFR